MRLTVGQVRALVCNALNEDARPQADEDDPLGKFAFASGRLDGGIPEEDDTPVEKALYKKLAYHFNQNEPLDNDSSALAQSFLKKGIYKPVFNQPLPNTVVYRGLMVDEAWLRQHAGFRPNEKIPKSGARGVTMTLKPHKGDDDSSHSWSLSKVVAFNFATSAPETDKYAVILHAKAGSNKDRFLSGPDGMYNVDPFNTFEQEEEVTALGAVNVYAITWTRLV